MKKFTARCLMIMMLTVCWAASSAADWVQVMPAETGFELLKNAKSGN
jgi:DNA-binding transcriptional regulator of glucitol operon